MSNPAMKYLGPPQSGSQAGTTASHNRAGQYLRNRRTPVSPTRTPKQSNQRNIFSQASALWATMTTSQQAAWTSVAAAHPVKDSLGQTVTLTGHQYFVGINSALLSSLNPTSLVPPTNFAVGDVSTSTVYADTSGTVLLTATAPASGDFVLAAASKLKSNGVTFNKTFSQFGVADSTDFLLDVSGEYSAQFGTPILGMKVFGRFTYVNADGVQGTPIIVNTSVGAPATGVAPVLTSVMASQITATYTGITSGTWVFFNATSGSEPYSEFSRTAVTTSPQVVMGFTSGDKYFARLFDGTAYGPKSNVITCM